MSNTRSRRQSVDNEKNNNAKWPKEQANEHEGNKQKLINMK